MRLLLIFSLLLINLQTVKAQEYPQNYFRSPLDIPLFLSGNFAELRSNHFHAGLDIKTQGTEGKKVYAVADGYVSRIKVSPYGYGNALYIRHPNGYTSVYGHLKKYSDKIATVVKEEQYRKQEFAVQLFPAVNLLKVKKGDIIAYSGNTGGSGGPHLHFEIRNTKTEHPINPQFFGFNLKDEVTPLIYAVALYPLDSNSTINGKCKKQFFKATKLNGKYTLAGGVQIKAHGNIGIGIRAIDKMNGTSNSYGLHNIKMLVNDKLYYEHQINEFAFHEGRYINSHVDFEHYLKTRRRFQKCFVAKGNKLRIYKTLTNNGVIPIEDSLTDVSFKISDLQNNSSSISFFLLKDSSSNCSYPEVRKERTLFYRNQKNTLLKNNLLLTLPPNVLYEDLVFNFSVDSSLQKAISPTYWLHNHFTPLHSYFTIAIKVPNITEKQKRNALIVSTTNGKNIYAEGGKWNGNTISVKSRSFGGYAVAIDSIAPTIKPVNIINGANMSDKWSISIKIKDNLSGIRKYNAWIDEKWVLMEYDAERNLLVHYFDESITKGEHQFKLLVTDRVGNKASFKASFRR